MYRIGWHTGEGFWDTDYFRNNRYLFLMFVMKDLFFRTHMVLYYRQQHFLNPQMKEAVMKKNLFATLAMVLALLTLSGFAGAKELNFALSGNPDTLDPHKTSGTLTFQTLKSVYDTLAEPDQTGKIVPALAEKWEISPDGMTWTFNLRKGVVFHNGDKLTSQDVKATFERIQAKETASPNANEYAPITAIETPDYQTIVLKLSAPSAPLLGT